MRIKKNGMQYLSALIITVAITTAPGRYAMAEQAGTPQVHLSRYQLHALMKDATTPEQYQFLAHYFRDRERKYEKQAERQRAEWDQRFATHGYGGMKNTSPQDTAKQIYEYYRQKAEQMKNKAVEYEGKMK